MPVWIAGALVLALILRIPWLGVGLGNDEGGLTYLAGAWNDDGPFAYGDYFIDRPPVLLALFRLAGMTGGTASVRTMGVVAVLGLVLVTSLLARQIAGDRAAGWAAVLTAGLGSSAAIGSVFTPAELLAVVPSALSVLMVWKGLSETRPRPGFLAVAGALGVGALLVKQSFGDALVAGLVCLAASAVLERHSGRALAVAGGAYLAGALVAVGALEVWESAAGIPDGSMSYAMLEFRLDGLSALAGSAGGLPGRFAERLVVPLVLSGLLVVLWWSASGLRKLRSDRVAAWTLGAWGAAGGIAVMAGGSYWAHYLIQLIPFAAVTASLALAATSTRAARITVAALAACAIGGVTLGPSTVKAEGVPAGVIGTYLKSNAHRGDTAHVLYSQANVLYYSGLRDPFPYNWSLMMRAVPRAEAKLRSLLASPRRPTWIVRWEPLRAYNLDRDGTTKRLLDRNYRSVGTICGTPVLVRKAVERSLPPPPAGGCS
ncbi:MAG: hypothetical protein WKF96_17240 [Solirubrobacteraceae bacterium]